MLKSLYGTKPFSTLFAKLKFHNSSKLPIAFGITTTAIANAIIKKMLILHINLLLFSFMLSPFFGLV